MDFSTFKTADWLVIVGGLMMLIAGFLDWFDAGPLEPERLRLHGHRSDPVAAARRRRRARRSSSPARSSRPGATPWPVDPARPHRVGAVLVLVRLIIGADLSDVVDLAGQPDQALSRPAACGWRRSAAWVAAAGGVMMFQADGGPSSDLPDLQKIRDAFKT